jgi:hypothetical protein
MHNCLGAWGARLPRLKIELTQLRTQFRSGWGRDLTKVDTYTRLVNLKGDLEWALGYGEASVTPLQGGMIVTQYVDPDSDSVASGLRIHLGGPNHQGPGDPPGQQGWLTAVDPNPTACAEAHDLLQRIKDCLDPVRGTGNKSGKPGSKERKDSEGEARTVIRRKVARKGRKGRK